MNVNPAGTHRCLIDNVPPIAWRLVLCAQPSAFFGAAKPTTRGLYLFVL
jgi:hypothetical protein